MLWHREAHINSQSNRFIIVDPAGLELDTTRLWQHRHLPVVGRVRFMPWKLCQKHNLNVMTGAALDNWQPVWNAQVSISTPVCVNFELRPGSADIYIYIYVYIYIVYIYMYIYILGFNCMAHRMMKIYLAIACARYTVITHTLSPTMTHTSSNIGR